MKDAFRSTYRLIAFFMRMFWAWLTAPMPELTPEQRAMLVRLEQHRNDL